MNPVHKALNTLDETLYKLSHRGHETVLYQQVREAIDLIRAEYPSPPLPEGATPLQVATVLSCIGDSTFTVTETPLHDRAYRLGGYSSQIAHEYHDIFAVGVTRSNSDEGVAFDHYLFCTDGSIHVQPWSPHYDRLECTKASVPEAPEATDRGMLEGP